jgi:2,4-dienoyl-CoA reductase-like NADH-dependent reductase (Old Yellow Enzyme family)
MPEEAKGVSKYPNLFKPIKIGKLEIKNRIESLPLSLNFSEPGRYIGPRLIAHYASIAKGGAGLIVAPVGLPAPFSPEMARFSTHAALYDATHMAGHSELVETVHAFGSKIFASTGCMEVSGRQTARDCPSVAASPGVMRIPRENLPKKAVKAHESRGLKPFLSDYWEGPMTGEMSVEEIVHWEDASSRTAGLVKECGYDGIWIHSCHGYADFSFLSPRQNFRTDMYGGSLENRTRWLRNTFFKIRDAVGADFPVGIRLSCSEHMPGGLSLEETIKICKMAESWGADYLDFSNGTWESFKYFVPDEDGVALPEVAEIKKEVHIPVTCLSIHDPEMGDRAVAEGKTDLIGLGRQLLADPEWPNKVAEGRPFTKCARCCIGCWDRLVKFLPLRCELNPNVGFEYQMPEYWRVNAPIKKTYYVPKAEEGG